MALHIESHWHKGTDMIKFAGINFDHMHMGDLLRYVSEHPNAEIVGISDENAERMQETAQALDISPEKIFTDYRKCLEETRPDVVILCPATGEHALWTERIAPFGMHILVEKPFASSLHDADAMIEAIHKTGKHLFINWPTAWFAGILTTKRVLDEGLVGEVVEFHHYGGNRGPLFHRADKVEVSAAQVAQEKAGSWWYKREKGGGSLLDYAGYGATLGTWFQNGRAPLEVTCVVDEPQGLEVDEHAIIVACYAQGLSKIETRWGTFSDPWTHQPQPTCGYVLVGTKGTISCPDYATILRIQTEDKSAGFDLPVDEVAVSMQNPIAHIVDVIENGTPIHGPLTTEISRIGQQIVDSAVQSAREKRTVKLLA